jgi:hypothetical protein
MRSSMENKTYFKGLRSINLFLMLDDYLDLQTRRINK